MTLYELDKSRKCILAKTPGNSLLNSIGVREGKKVSMVTKQPLGGPIVVQVDKRNIAISKDIACQIEIEEE
ncbi:FeoA family protein [Gottschalkia acidurici 9a]|uniref:FeoA family protein n=1 Tax=Gottschalkia acidurici (strain ATCC 7906 / DSM 604 / BCRC 14475 / CIP 104303 / KCTC 5404 / NCIMB 10678 / 9a) TaxID=1128398 RepID=K0AXH9_GOTA9|nr:FeoA family protein [Gottschalkia acidurici]AFS77430.1 FeoA family protein [Gottschalkia acidurici 9a]